MSEHFFVAADHAHLRIFRQRQDPGQLAADLEEVESMDFPAGKRSYVARDTSMAGRFQGSQSQATTPAGMPGARTGMSIDERLPMQREEERRRVRDVAQEIETFFVAHRDATWDFASGPEMHNAVLALLSDRLKGQLRRKITKDLANQPLQSVRALFVAPAPQ